MVLFQTIWQSYNEFRKHFIIAKTAFFFQENKKQLELMWTLCYELNESVLCFEQAHFLPY